MVAIGIDLGTTYCCVAVWKDGQAQVIANKHGNTTTPSYVAFTNKGRLIGEDAKNQAAANPWNTIFAAKRLIGRRYDDLEIQMGLRHWPFHVSNDNGKPKIAVEYKGKQTYFAPEEISSMILYRMKQIAESYLGTVVKDAVITVPAHFSDAQRLATKTAGIIAGLNVIRIINEPTAAALAYGLNRNLKGEKNILIYDLGGGTVDVSVLTVSEGSMYEVKATVGNLKLGGEDFDNRIVAYLSEDFRKKYFMSILPNVKALRRLKTAAEIAKRSLSSTLNTVIKIESICNGIDYQGILSRSLFEELCLDLFIDTLQPVEKAVESANLKKEDIQEIILVGGSTRIPKIRTMLEEYFGKPVTTSINPDEAVAYGAAIQAAILADETHQKLKDFLLVDVVPLTLGVEIVRGAMLPIVERNSRIPCRYSREITTLEDYQTAMTIEIFEGERTMTKDNNLLGTFDLTGIPPAPRGIPKVDLTFDIDANGILTVSARDQSTGSTNSLVVRNENRLTQDEIDRMIAEAERFKEEDKEKKSSVEARNQLETYVYNVKLTVTEQKNKLTDEELSIMMMECQRALTWLEDNMECSKEEYAMKMTEYMRKWAKIMNKFYEEKLRHRVKRHKSESQFLEELEAAVAASYEEISVLESPGPSKM